MTSEVESFCGGEKGTSCKKGRQSGKKKKKRENPLEERPVQLLRKKEASEISASRPEKLGKKRRS